jgi:hypothetical protein
MKRSIVEVSMPQHYRDSSLSSLDSLFSNISDSEIRQMADNAVVDYHQHPQPPFRQSHHQTTIDYQQDSQQQQQQQQHSYCSSFDDINNTNVYMTMQEEYDSSTKQPTPGRPKMARILASSSPEISALCRKSSTNSSAALQLLPFDYDNDINHQDLDSNKNDGNTLLNSEQQGLFDFGQVPFQFADQHNSYNLSSDSSNFSMSSSSMESVSYPPVNRTSSASISTWEDPPPRIANRKSTWMKRFGGDNTAQTVSSAAATAASVTTTTTTGTIRRPAYVSVSSPTNEDTSGLNYSGSDMELEAITASLNTIQIYHPEPRRRDSLSSYASAPTRSPTPYGQSAVGQAPSSCGAGIQRPTLHRRISYDSLPTPEMIMYETVPLETSLPSPLPPPPLPPPPPPPLPALLQRSSSDRLFPPSSPLLNNRHSSGSSTGSRHRRNTTQIVMPPIKPAVTS